MLSRCEFVIVDSRLEDVFGIDFLYGSSGGILVSVPLWKDFVHFSRLLRLDSLPVAVVASAVVVVLRRVLATDSWEDLLGIRTMVGISVVLKPTGLMQLVPDRLFNGCLDLSLFGECWLISDGEVLIFKADAMDWLI